MCINTVFILLLAIPRRIGDRREFGEVLALLGLHLPIRLNAPSSVRD
jgi:hypothetical protein